MHATVSPPESRFDRRRLPDGLVFTNWTAPDGWRHRAYRWPAPTGAVRGSLLFQGGRADFIEKYLEAGDQWWRGGWQVEGFDWRGQGGSGRIAPAGNADDRASFDPLIDDLEAFVTAWRARTPGPHVLVSHSMGAHVALRMLAERGIVLDAGALVAPMLSVRTGPIPTMLARLIASGIVALGLGGKGVVRKMPSDRYRQRRLTADRDRFEDSQWWKRARPELALGGPTWRWLAAALEGARRIERPGVLERIATPVLLLEAGLDKLVDPRAIARAAERLPDAELLCFPTASHELLREADADRSAAFAAIDRFFAARAPAA